MATVEASVGVLDCCADVSSSIISRDKCLVVVTIVTVLISLADVGTDWYNWVEYKSYVSDASTLYTDVDNSILQAVADGLLAVCCLGCLWFVLECVTAHFRIRYLRKGDKPTDGFKACESLLALLVVLTEDLPTAVIFFASFLIPICPVLKQAKTIPGYLTLSTSAFSALWRFLTLVCCSCCCCCCKERKEKKKCNCKRCCNIFIKVLRVPVQLTAISFATVLIAIVSLRPEDVSPSDSMLTLKHPMYLHYRPPLGYNCSSLQLEANITSFTKIKEAADESLILRTPCEDVTPFYSQLATYDPSYADSCDMIVTLSYNYVYGQLLYGVYMDMKNANGDCKRVDAILETDRFQYPSVPQHLLTQPVRDTICKDCNIYSSGIVQDRLELYFSGKDKYSYPHLEGCPVELKKDSNQHSSCSTSELIQVAYSSTYCDPEKEETESAAASRSIFG